MPPLSAHRRSRPRRPLLASCVAAALIATPATLAGPPGGWTRVTDVNGVNTDQVGMVRHAGVLHALWQRHAADGTESVQHTRISPTGAVGPPSQVAGGFSAVDDPDGTVTPDGRLRAFFMGLGSTPAEGGVVAANGSGSGTDWVRDGVRVSSTTSAVGPVGAATTAGGAPIFTYAFAFHLGVHTGLDPNVPDTELQPDALCCDYQPDVATDAAGGRTLVAWFSNATGRTGTWVRSVVPPGPPVFAPGSATNGQAVSPSRRTALVARAGGGLYAAYCGGWPTCRRALLWRVDAPGARVVATGPRVEDVHASAGPGGRIWVMWHDGRRIFARRSNRTVTRFGPVVGVTPPGGTSAIWGVGGDGSPGILDLFASVSRPGSLATWHTQVRPPLTLTSAKLGAKVVFRVADAGDPVAGAKVAFGGKTFTTNALGRALAPRRTKPTLAVATRPGYRPATIVVRP